MKAQNFLLAFVNQRRVGTNIDPTCTRNEFHVHGSYLVRHHKPSLQLWSNDDNEDNVHGHSHNRRMIFQTISFQAISSILLSTNANAACLSGDIRAKCIGVYKLPIDAAESKYVETPEMLKMYAPDLEWVEPVPYPGSYADALAQLKNQRQQLDTSQALIAKGSIEEAGLVLLDVTPKVKAAGIVIIKSFGNASNKERNAAMKRKDTVIMNNDGNPSSTTKATTLEIRAYRIDDALNELMGTLGETDVLMGQALRGELGVSAPAQIQILSTLKDCMREFDNLLLTVPEKMG